MGKKKINIKFHGGFPAGILFLCGFLLGSVLPNLIWKMQWQQKTVASYYLLGTFAHRNVAGWEYFFEVLRTRGSYLLLYILCGFSVFGVPMAVAGVLLAGLVIGALLTMSVLQFGLAGGALGLGILLPQYLIYLPVTIYLMTVIYRQSVDIWKKNGIFTQKTYLYCIQAFFAALAYLAGIFLESYVNPWVVEKIVKGLKFF